jgi:hypothetical protein
VIKLSLARWESGSEESIGYWLIREIPGLSLVRGRQKPMRWHIKADIDEYQAVPWGPLRVWGTDSPDMDVAEELMQKFVPPAEGFHSRAAALHFLQMTCPQPETASALSGLL